MIDHLREKGRGVDPICRILQLSPSTYFARKKRPKSARSLRDEQLMPLIEQLHADSGGTYGARRITRALRCKGIVVARRTVERLMRELGLEGVIRRRRRTTVPDPSAPRPPDLVDRDFRGGNEQNRGQDSAIVSPPTSTALRTHRRLGLHSKERIPQLSGTSCRTNSLP
ncbi:IS3 family transposase [Streptomyces sp. TRM49041]|uniref:IS3 family transposase n=1 Tax=Streptomyces sp. TRM49041 TaxID=2603216 RepID=UPI0011EDA87C